MCGNRGGTRASRVVQRTLSFAFTSAPASSSVDTTAATSFSVARCSGVLPSCARMTQPQHACVQGGTAACAWQSNAAAAHLGFLRLLVCAVPQQQRGDGRVAVVRGKMQRRPCASLRRRKRVSRRCKAATASGPRRAAEARTLSVAFTPAPWSSSAVTTESQPFRAASCSGVRPVCNRWQKKRQHTTHGSKGAQAALRVAPQTQNGAAGAHQSEGTPTAQRRGCRGAACMSPLLTLLLLASLSAPRCSSSVTTSTWPFAAASCSAVLPSCAPGSAAAQPSAPHVPRARPPGRAAAFAALPTSAQGGAGWRTQSHCLARGLRSAYAAQPRSRVPAPRCGSWRLRPAPARRRLQPHPRWLQLP